MRSLLRLVQAQRRIDRASLTIAAVYAAQAALSALLVILIYNRFQLGSATWAVVSAVLVLQPDLKRSYGASATRFFANLIGALTGALVDHLHGHGPIDVMAALVLVVAFCELLRLDQGLRSACASTVIVMMSVNNAVVAHATEQRVMAVIIGCSTALLVRILFEQILRATGGTPATETGEPTQADEG